MNNREDDDVNDHRAKKRKVDNLSKDHWPEWLKELEKIHFRLNSYFTFISSRRQIIPKFETLKQPVEKAIGRELTLEDGAMLAVLLPDDVLFKYVDENQFLTEKKEFQWQKGHIQKDLDLFKLRDMELTEQVLVFEFIDGNLSKTRTKSAFYTEMKNAELYPGVYEEADTEENKQIYTSCK